MLTLLNPGRRETGRLADGQARDGEPDRPSPGPDVFLSIDILNT